MLTLLRAALARLLPAADPAACGVPRSPRWAAARAAWLRGHPTCAACGGRENLQVHHVWPVHWPGGKDSELSPDNFMTLCGSPARLCHLRDGHLWDFRSRNPSARADAAAQLDKIVNRPYPIHAPE
jgi:5-methylcytosine-specific restriction enzyme A